MKITIPPAGTELTLTPIKQGEIEIIQIPIRVTVKETSFLHIGASPSPLTEKKGAVFKVGRTPVIPASSLKGALRNQFEHLFIAQRGSFAEQFNLPDTEKPLLKPCIPASDASKAELDLQNLYRIRNCQLQPKEGKERQKGKEQEYKGLCPVCYFMGAAGIMGFLRMSNLFPKPGDLLVDQMKIRIDRKTGTAAKGETVTLEQVKPGTQFTGLIDVVISSPIGLDFGSPRKIDEKVIDCWLGYWQENDRETRRKVLLERILIPALQRICLLGGQKSVGSGNVTVSIGGEGK